MTRLYFVGEQPFAVLKGKGTGGADAREQACLAFARIRTDLEGLGCGLQDLVRMAVFTRDQGCRPAVSEVRRELFPESVRPASSSLIAHDLSDTLVEIEATALLARGRVVTRKGIEFDPPRAYVKALAAGDFLFLSGTGGRGEGMESQVLSALDTIESNLRELGSAGSKLFHLTLHVRRSEGVVNAHKIVQQRVGRGVALEFTLCDEFARPEMLVEVEGSAWRQ